MKYLVHTEEVVVPKGVSVNSVARTVTVTGPKGTLIRKFKKT
jgi:ribosomal protein L6P/L9E